MLEQRADPFEPLGGHRYRTGFTARADAPARAGGERNERQFLAARRAAGEVREVSRQPHELKLKGEDERVDRGLGGERRLDVVEEVEEAGQRVERRLVGLLLDEEAQHRLEADVA